MDTATAILCKAVGTFEANCFKGFSMSLSKGRARAFLLILSVWLTTTAFDCPWAPKPDPGTHALPITHAVQLQCYYCVPATIVMWSTYLYGNQPDTTQTNVWNWMANNPSYPGQTTAACGRGTSEGLAAVAAATFLKRAIGLEEYSGYNGRRQAVADQERGIDIGTPTIALVNGATHVVLVRGATWTELDDALKRPRNEFVMVHDPAAQPNGAYTVGEWLNGRIRLTTNCGAAVDCARSIQLGGLKDSAAQALATFDQAGGVIEGPGPQNPTGRYKLNGQGSCYWEPNDSGPNQCTPSATGRYKLDGSGNCYWDPNDSGPNQCTPELLQAAGNSLWSRARRAGLGAFGNLSSRPRVSTMSLTTWRGAGSHAPRPGTPSAAAEARSAARDDLADPPYPLATEPAKIMANLVHEARESGLDRALGIPALAMRNKELEARRILPVRDVSDSRDYYVVELVDRQGRRVADVAITAAGEIMGGQAITKADNPSLDTVAVQNRVRNKMGRLPTKVRYVYAHNTVEPGSSIFRPLAVADTASGPVYFNSSGEAFAELSSPLLKQVPADDPVRSLPGEVLKLKKLDWN
jgi:hypothetical protein